MNYTRLQMFLLYVIVMQNAINVVFTNNTMEIDYINAV